MPNALDMYRAHQTAANEVHAKLSEVATLMQRIRVEVNALAQDHRLQEVLRQEQTWLEQAERTVKEVQRWRDLDAYRFWPGVVHRWALASVFALASAWIAGAGFGWTTRPYEAEVATLRHRAQLAESIERRRQAMTSAERRQFDTLMKTSPATKPDARDFGFGPQ